MDTDQNSRDLFLVNSLHKSYLDLWPQLGFLLPLPQLEQYSQRRICFFQVGLLAQNCCPACLESGSGD